MSPPAGNGLHRSRRGAPDGPARPAAEHVAAEVFVYLMRRRRVRHFDLAVWCVTRSITHHGFSGPKHEVVLRYELAPPFWPLTMGRNQGVLSGYGVNRDGSCISYEEYRHPATKQVDGLTVERTVFAPGSRELMGRASRTSPVFVCEPLAIGRVSEILKHYLIDALISLTEGRGAVVVNGGS